MYQDVQKISKVFKIFNFLKWLIFDLDKLVNKYNLYIIILRICSLEMEQQKFNLLLSFLCFYFFKECYKVNKIM